MSNNMTHVMSVETWREFKIALFSSPISRFDYQSYIFLVLCVIFSFRSSVGIEHTYNRHWLGMMIIITSNTEGRRGRNAWVTGTMDSLHKQMMKNEKRCDRKNESSLVFPVDSFLCFVIPFSSWIVLHVIFLVFLAMRRAFLFPIILPVTSLLVIVIPQWTWAFNPSLCSSTTTCSCINNDHDWQWIVELHDRFVCIRDRSRFKLYFLNQLS